MTRLALCLVLACLPLACDDGQGAAPSDAGLDLSVGDGRAEGPDATEADRGGEPADAAVDGARDQGGVPPDAAPPCEPVGDDEPDPANLDADCDGIDGTIARAVFVAPDGDDEGLGDLDRPVKSLARAIEVARVKRATQILVAAGDYLEPEVIRLEGGIGLHGGYEPGRGWARGTLPTVIAGPALAMVAEALEEPASLSRLVVSAADAAEPGGASVALRGVASELTLYDGVELRAGLGGAGIDGTPGEAGGDGLDGLEGLAGSRDDQFDNGEGGQPGVNMLCPMANGGRGGGGGRSPSFRGEVGQPSPGGAMGGPGGSANGCSPARGTDGRDGGLAVDGTPGAPGAGLGRFSVEPGGEGVYQAADGGRGGDGRPGIGGGGGGGSSGQTGARCVDGAGNGGGGGGAGGCAGTGGGGGGGGGASVALLLFEAPIRLDGVLLRTAGGGAGGAGQPGGGGGRGGRGGPGSDYSAGDVGIAGDGGDGSNGGAGAHGGGGGGGPSVGIWVHGAPPTLANVTFDLGPGGAAGGGPRMGEAGQVDQVLD